MVRPSTFLQTNYIPSIVPSSTQPLAPSGISTSHQPPIRSRSCTFVPACSKKRSLDAASGELFTDTTDCITIADSGLFINARCLRENENDITPTASNSNPHTPASTQRFRPT